VLLQSRVVGGRPIAGLMHAAVFLGFLAFGLETIDHFLEGLGVPFLSPILGGSLSVFKTFLAVMAILVSVAIIGLAFRRFVLVKISPDPKSYSSGLVALLILLLMLTYLNGIRETPLAAKANWWFHSLIVIVFPHLILRSKHFHILMAPVNIFFRTHQLGDYLPLNLDMEAMAEAGEVNLGLENLAQVPWKMRMDFLTCVECKRCTDQCPAANCGQELDPRGFILAGREALNRNGTNGAVIGSIISENALGQCTSCGACENICPVGIEHLQLLLGAKRAQALAIGKGMVAPEFLEMINQYGNPFSASKDVRASLIEALEIPFYEKGKTEHLLWLGCVWAYNTDARGSVEAMVTVLKHAGVSFGVLENEACCGHHSRRQGEEMQFQNLANENINVLRQQGVKKIISPCPHCLHTMRREYPTLQEKFSLELIHHSEFLGNLITTGAIQLHAANSKARPVAYHDPCYLGRYEGLYAAPRAVIERAGGELRELPRHGAKSFCCGGGSAGFVREQKVARRVDQERKAEIAASGAKVLVTACPECKMMLNSAVEETKDLAEWVAESMRVAEHNGRKLLSATEGNMLVDYATTTEVADQIRQYFILHPGEELHLLGIVKHAHVSGNLNELRHIADELVAQGDLVVETRYGARYYRLAKK
jgi:Fe-S oxidoreductase